MEHKEKFKEHRTMLIALMNQCNDAIQYLRCLRTLRSQKDNDCKGYISEALITKLILTICQIGGFDTHSFGITDILKFVSTNRMIYLVPHLEIDDTVKRYLAKLEILNKSVSYFYGLRNQMLAHLSRKELMKHKSSDIHPLYLIPNEAAKGKNPSFDEFEKTVSEYLKGASEILDYCNSIIAEEYRMKMNLTVNLNNHG